MFWLLYMHAISINTAGNVTAKDFWRPKAILCSLQFLYLVVIRMFVFTHFEKDPFFDAITHQHHMTTTYLGIYSTGIALNTIYILYFSKLTYAALPTIRTFQASYLMITIITTIVMLASLTLIILNG